MARREIEWRRTQIKRDKWEKKFAFLFKTVLNKQFRDLAGKIDTTNIGSQSVLLIIDKDPVEKAMISLYRNVGADFAKDQYRRLKLRSADLLTKQEDEYEDVWMEEMEAYVRTQAGKKITSIVAQSREQAMKIIREKINISTEEGWGADQLAREIKKALLTDGIEMNQWRALRIARTEVVSASNKGAMEGARKTGYAMLKFWIATYDNRTRDTHLTVEEQNPKEMDEVFRVGEAEMMEPGEAVNGDFPEEIINCRCSVAFEIKD